MTRTCGVRSTYVSGCRCDLCRESNRLYQRQHLGTGNSVNGQPTCIHCDRPILGISVGWKHVSDNRQFGDDGHEAAPKVIA